MVFFKKKSEVDHADEDVHHDLEHGGEVLEEELKKFGFCSLEEVDDYFRKSARAYFGHVSSPYIPLEILMVAEKPRMALDLVKRLMIGRRYTSVGEGHRKVYHFRAKVFGRIANVKMVSTYGHLNKQQFTTELSDTKHDQALYAKIADVSCSNKLSYEFFAKVGQGCDAVILWLDNDHEGEAICFEVIHYLLNYKNFHMNAFFRARFSSPSEAETAMENLDRPDFRRYLAMVAKHHLDLRAGVSFSRCQKYAAKEVFGTYIYKLSFGPCSTSTVALIVDHYLKTKDLPTKYCLEYSVIVDGQELCIRSDPLDEEEAKERYASLQNFDQCQVTGARDELVTVKAPVGLNSFELLQDLSKYYGFSAAETAKCAQDLYEMGMITYPRTETSKYHHDLKLAPQVLHDNLLELMKFEDPGFTPDMCFDVRKAMERGIDKGDHPPIMPVCKQLGSGYAKRLKDKHIKVYHYICRRFLASFMPDYCYSKKTVKFDMGGVNELLHSVRQHATLGFTQVLHEHKVDTPGDAVFAKLVHGANFKFTVSVKQFPRPKLLREHELIQQMEKYSIGTDGTIPNHIDFIKNERFVTIDHQTRELQPTALGIKMIEGYRTCVPEMIDPKYRAKFIQNIEEIANEERHFVTVYDESLKAIHSFYQRFNEHIKMYMKEAEKEMRPLVLEFNNKEMEKCQREAAAAKKLKIEK